MTMAKTEHPGELAPGTTDMLTVRDERTGQSYVIPIHDGTIRATDLSRIRTSADDPGLMTYDPGLMSTAAVKSAITFIDGDKGILRYRGYPIEEVAERSSFLEVAYLLLEGELPTDQQLAEWSDTITHHTFLHENIKKFIDGFRHDAHPMGILMSTVAALSTFYPEAKRIQDKPLRRSQIVRLIAKMPTIAAFAYRHAVGLPYSYPDNDLAYVGNFLNMMWKTTELKYKPDPILERALEILFILHADHEQNCSTSTVRVVGSSRADPYSAVAALSTFYPEAVQVDDPENRLLQAKRLIAKVPTLAAWTYRHSRGLPYVYPDNDLSFAGNFLSMMFRMAEPRYVADPVLERALEVLFILHADH